MLKLNKKGVTLIELIVSFALVATAVIYFYQTLSTVYDLYVTSKKETQEYVDKDYAMRIVDAYVNAKGTDYISNVCGKYIVCDDVDFTPGEINVITIKKGSKAWIKYYTVKKDTIAPEIDEIYAKLEGGEAINFTEKLNELFDNSYDNYEKFEIKVNNLKEDEIIVYDTDNNEIYNYKKEYTIKEDNVFNGIAEEINQKNGTESILYYCDDKSWCDDVEVVNNSIKLFRNNNPIANMTYSTDITLEKDTTRVVSNEKTYTKEKSYGVSETDEINKLTEYFRKNGTIGISKYCDGKSWCNIVGTNTWEGETTISLYRSNTKILNKIYKKDDVVKNLDASGNSKFFPVYGDYNNVITSAFAGTSTSYTFDKLFSSKAVKVCYSLWNDYNDAITLSNTTVVSLVGEDGNDIPFYLDSQYTTQTEHGFLVSNNYPSSYCNTFKPSDSNKKFRVKIKNIHSNNVAYYTVFTAVESIEEIN